ncbi:type II toxin-antitoxin system YafQ family toxin [Acutalibacter muris]|jgi:mRNA interferase YafQ|uniref:Type II toxin-antitoxin system YafQ family toxin n=1 Tax=Acutalibacter muris TaxID=1796620 RepID=A0A1Z2XR45_9FIRM|nr:type II toxin-antitoxin system YafQ family toxin [Acutalibacter muris]ANU55856.1 YafQ family addiction module toxin [Hungateiclostridiaceae bacterium KB18]ASB40900.1 type II toxin-antitoxin system mRNA interferase toxin, RelE/StbE family [Acutalibacter muris]QQR30183.1 type II toxin-antitoxin system YafQ family toxin [Acutalibacter muris]
MLKLNVSSQFRRDRRLCGKRGYNLALLENAVDTLLVPAALPEQNRNHQLTGNWAGFQECHLAPDWLLIYRVDGNELYLVRTGTHADLFSK